MSIKVTLLYFGQAREGAGSAKEEFSVPSGSSVDSVMEEVAARHPGLRKLMSTSQVAVNEELASGDSKLSDGDVLAVLPPVAGG